MERTFLVGGLRRWYNPPWFSELVPSTPYDPLLVRNTFEKVNSGVLSSSRSSLTNADLVLEIWMWSFLWTAGCYKTTNDWCAFWCPPIWRIRLIPCCFSSVTPSGKIRSCLSVGFKVAHILYRFEGLDPISQNVFTKSFLCSSRFVISSDFFSGIPGSESWQRSRWLFRNSPPWVTLYSPGKVSLSHLQRVLSVKICFIDWLFVSFSNDNIRTE